MPCTQHLRPPATGPLGAGRLAPSRGFAAEAPSRSSNEGPVSWASLTLALLTGGGIVWYFNRERSRIKAGKRPGRCPACLLGQPCLRATQSASRARSRGRAHGHPHCGGSSLGRSVPTGQSGRQGGDGTVAARRLRTAVLWLHALSGHLSGRARQGGLRHRRSGCAPRVSMRLIPATHQLPACKAYTSPPAREQRSKRVTKWCPSSSLSTRSVTMLPWSRAT